MLTVLFVATLTAAMAQVSFPLPFTPVPFTLQPMIVLLGGAALGARQGAASQILYLMAGLVGLPVFAFAPDLLQGLPRLLGPSGGYLMAYPLAAFVTGWLLERAGRRTFVASLVASTAGLAVIFAAGVLWLAKDMGLAAALAVGLVPFVMADAIKIVVAAAALPTVGRLLKD